MLELHVQLDCFIKVSTWIKQLEFVKRAPDSMFTVNDETVLRYIFKILRLNLIYGKLKIVL